MNEQKKKVDILYGFNDRPNKFLLLPLAVQHIVAMFVANITVPLLVSQLLQLSHQEASFLIQGALLSSGLATLVQVSRRWSIGSGLPIIMGTSNAFIATILVITQSYNIPTVLGASVVGGLIEIFIGFNLVRLKKLITPLISGTIVLTIGITLIPVAIRQAMDLSSADASMHSMMISGLVLLVIIICSSSRNKRIKSSSILIGIVVGYMLTYFFGTLPLEAVGEAKVFAVPNIMRYGWEFRLGPIIAIGFMFFATSIETIGDVSAITDTAENREPTAKELKGALLCDGAASILATFFNAFPNTSYTQNIGVMQLTGIFSRAVVRVGAVLLIIASFFPKFASVLAIIPAPVLGGASLVMFSMIVVSGISLLQKVDLTNRNMLIIAVSVGLGVGLNVVPEFTSLLSKDLQFILTSGVVPAGVVAIVMNQIVPKEQKHAE